MSSVRYRSAVTGRFVTKEFAREHPRITVTEQIWLSRQIRLDSGAAERPHQQLKNGEVVG